MDGAVLFDGAFVATIIMTTGSDTVPSYEINDSIIIKHIATITKSIQSTFFVVSTMTLLDHVETPW